MASDPRQPVVLRSYLTITGSFPHVSSPVPINVSVPVGRAVMAKIIPVMAFLCVPSWPIMVTSVCLARADGNVWAAVPGLT